MSADVKSVCRKKTKTAIGQFKSVVDITTLPIGQLKSVTDDTKSVIGQVQLRLLTVG